MDESRDFLLAGGEREREERGERERERESESERVSTCK